MKALNDFVIIQGIEPKKKKSFIILTSEEKPKTIEGKVLSVGKQCKELKKGDIVLVSPYNDEIEHDGIKYMLCREKDLAVKLSK